MFSDFREHVIGVPQIAPRVDQHSCSTGPGANEDFGLEQVTGDPADRYAFRTSPLRNVALQPAFMHNGAFTSLEDADRAPPRCRSIRTHLRPGAAGLDPDLTGPPGPIEPALSRLDVLVATERDLSSDQVDAVVSFRAHGLLDPRATPDRLRRLVPDTLPSGRAPLTFEFPSR